MYIFQLEVVYIDLYMGCPVMINHFYVNQAVTGSANLNQLRTMGSQNKLVKGLYLDLCNV